MFDLLRATAVFFFLIALFRLAGKRALKDVTVFDFVLLLIVSECTQQALVGEDYSLMACFVTITTLVMLDIGLSLLKQRFRGIAKLLDGVPLVLVSEGQPIRERLEKERIEEEDILEAARAAHGVERMAQVKYAVLERNGMITVVPRG